MDDKGIYKPLFAFAQSYRDALAPLNQRTMSFFDSDPVRDALSTLSSTIRISVSTDIISPNIQESLASIKHSI